MKNRRQPLSFIAALGTSILLTATACGTGEEAGRASPSPADSQNRSTTPDDAGDGAGRALRVTYAPTAAWLPAVVASEEGIFADNGLDVELTEVQNIDTAIGALGRQFDIISQTPTGVIYAAARGIDVTAISGNTVESEANQQLALLAAADSDIESYEDLKGKTIGAPSLTGAVHLATLKALTAAGLTPEDVRTVEVAFPNMGDQLAAGTVDAVEQVHPFVGALEGSGAARSIGDPLLSVNDGDPVALTLWAADANWARNNPETIQQWTASLEQAADFVEEHPDESRAILQDFTNLPEEIATTLPLPQYDVSMGPEEMQIWIDLMRDVGEDPKELAGEQVVAGTSSQDG